MSASVPKQFASGPFADVWLVGEALEEFEALGVRTDETSVREHCQLERFFERYANDGPPSLTDKSFKRIGRVKDATGKETAIFEFKAYQFRIYGVVRTFRGKRSFVGTACDPKKKKNKADPKKIRKAAHEASGLGE